MKFYEVTVDDGEVTDVTKLEQHDKGEVFPVTFDSSQLTFVVSAGNVSAAADVALLAYSKLWDAFKEKIDNALLTEAR